MQFAGEVLVLPEPLAQVIMIQKKTFCINSWKRWDDEINQAVQEIRGAFLIFPNILLANRITLNRIDIAANKNKIKDSAGNTAPQGQHCGIDGFISTDYDLDFYLDEKLPDKHFSLIYDSDPSDDGEPVPIEDTDLHYYFKKTGTD